MFKFISNSEIDTINFAKDFASKLNIGDTIVLCGNLGSGKTKFTEGVLTHFNLQDEVSSPTFTIVNEYSSNSINIYHFDVYRLSSSDEFFAIGGEEYFSKGICIIEWGELIEDALPPSYIKISFSKDTKDMNKRIISVEFINKTIEKKL